MSGADDSRERPLAAAQVASSLPGRLRLRLADGVWRRDRLAAAAESVGENAEVVGVETRWRSGSLVIEYDPAGAGTLWASLGELGLARSGSAATRAEAGTGGAPARLAEGLTRVNDVVAWRARGSDLRTLVPVGLGMLALRQLVRGDERLADAPWYVLAWYASETFQRFHGSARGE
jgi:hypothetical protein